MPDDVRRRPIGNPILREPFTADPTVLVVGDVLYLYATRDEAAVGEHDYVIREWRCFSTRDLATWHAHGVPLRAGDFAWGRGDAFAAKAVAHGGRFYLFAPTTLRDGFGKGIGVAVADAPAGPFRDALGRPLVTNDVLPPGAGEKDNIDPTAWVDGAGHARLFWGAKRCYTARLTGDLLALDSPVARVELPDFEEGAHVHRRGDWYYLAYGYGSPERVAYAMARSIDGPWRFRGVLNELAGNCETNRVALVTFRGRDYCFYHNGGLPTGGSHRRSVCVDALHYDDDGTIRRVAMTSEGVGAAE